MRRQFRNHHESRNQEFGHRHGSHERFAFGDRHDHRDPRERHDACRERSHPRGHRGHDRSPARGAEMFDPMRGGPHGRGRGRGHGRHGSGRHGRRGDVRLAILSLLAERPMHGYEMITELDTRTGGVWRPSPGSIYPTLQMLEDEGLIVSQTDGGRKQFSLTDTGRTAADQTETAPWDEFSPKVVESGHDTRQAMFGIMQALRQIGFSGTDEQRAKAVELLDETRRRLYAILAES